MNKTEFTGLDPLLDDLSPDQEERRIVFIVEIEHHAKRLDQLLAEYCSTYSRSQLQKWVKAQRVTVDGKVLRSKDKINYGSEIIVNPEAEEQVTDLPEPIPLDIVYEDQDIIVINKPAGLVVHPGAGNHQGTLVNALLHYDARLSQVPRAGIVHRLDKDTSGLMVIARHLESHHHLVSQLQERSVSREYLALVFGEMVAGDTIDAPIGRHPIDRKKMAVVEHGGKEAITHYRVAARYHGFTLVRVALETGRTHQIRVHMTSRLYPLIGDQVYRGRARVPAGLEETTRNAVRRFPRQALHATRLSLEHPTNGEVMSWEVGMPEDMLRLLDILPVQS